jgi:hypothetical protein
MAKLTAVPSLKSSKSALRLKQNIILSVLCAGFLMGPLGMIISANKTIPTPVVNVPLEAQTYGVVSFARTVAEDYLSGRATLLPAAKDVPQDFGRGTDSGAMAHGNLDLISVKIPSVQTEGVGVSYAVTFRFQSDAASLWQIQIIVHPGGGQPVLGALPSLTPFVVQGNFGANGTLDQIGLGGALIEVPPAVVSKAVTDWAKVYVGSDAEALKEHVNVNGDAAYSYTPLVGGFTLLDTRVFGVTTAPSLPSGYIARVRLHLQKGSFITSTEYDVLVIDDSVGHVLAWGAPGSGPNLTPQGNRNP